MTRVICDTNVWYNIATGNFIPPTNVMLVPTQFSLYELVTTEQIATNPELVQKTIKAVNDYGRDIIPVNPFDFVLFHQSSRFSDWNTEFTINILKSFNEMLNADLSRVAELSDELMTKIRTESKKSRMDSKDFVDYGNDLLTGVRKNVKKTVGRKAHLLENRDEEMKSLIVGFLNAYLNSRHEKIEFDHMNWSYLDLFLVVTENFFKKLETTDNMKIHPNDTTDWLNMLYVQPGDKYLTFEKSWKNYIINDDRIKHYYYT